MIAIRTSSPAGHATAPKWTRSLARHVRRPALIRLVLGLALLAPATVWAAGGWEEVVVEFVSPSFYQQYQRYVLLVGVVFSAQLALLGGLLVQRVQRRRAEDLTRRTEERYQSIVETRRRAEEAITQLEARNSAMLRAIPDLMFVLKRDGTYLDYRAREARLLAVPPERFLGRTVRDVMPPAFADQLMAGIEAAFASDEPVVIEYELANACFEARLVRVEADRVLSIVRDVTDSKRIREVTRNIAGRLITSQEAERSRIARELHDGVCQEMASLAVDVSYLRHKHGSVQSAEIQAMLQSIERHAAEIAESLRLISHGLHPTVLQHIGLVAALQAHCAEVERRHHLEVTCFVDGEVEPSSQLVALSLFRIAQEALRNTTKHGQAKHARVSLVRGESDFSLSVVDDGKGFDVQLVRQNGGLGLVGIEERARLVHGRANVLSRPGRGTTVNVRVPVDAAATRAGTLD